MHHKIVFILFVCFLSCARRHVSNENASFTIKILNLESRSSRLAAKELKLYLDKILKSGKKTNHTFMIGSAKDSGIKDIIEYNFDDGSFLIRTEGDKTFLIGNDENFSPTEPYAIDRSNTSLSNEKLDKLSKSYWENPFNSLFKSYNKELDIWEQDGRGTINAVYKYLEECGYRWYMPGEIGEFYKPTSETSLNINKLFKPDLRIRNLGFYGKRFFQCTKDDLLWILRLKLNSGFDILGNTPLGHGIMHLHSRPEVQNLHPEFFGLFNGSRDFSSREIGKPCLSSRELFNENLKFCRFIFDHYNEPSISVMPPDAFSEGCSCDKCKINMALISDNGNGISNYVWSYVNEIARELYKTHPNKLVTCFAYGKYLNPPSTIDKLSPNILVGLTRTKLNDKYANNDIIDAWKKKTSNKFIFWDYYLYNQAEGAIFKIWQSFESIIGSDLRKHKAIILGEYVEVFRETNGEDLLSNHFNIYATSELYWNTSAESEKSIIYRYQNDVFGNDSNYLNLYNFIVKNSSLVLKSINALDTALNLVKQCNTEKYSRLGKLFIDQYKIHLNSIRNQLLAAQRPNTDEVNLRAIRRSDNLISIDGNYSNDTYWKGLFEYKYGNNDSKTYFKTTWINNSILVGFKVVSASKSSIDKFVFKFESSLDNIYYFEFYRNGKVRVLSGDQTELLIDGISFAMVENSEGWEGEFILPVSKDIIYLTKREKIFAIEASINDPWYTNFYTFNGKLRTQYYGVGSNQILSEFVRMIVR